MKKYINKSKNNNIIIKMKNYINKSKNNNIIIN